NKSLGWLSYRQRSKKEMGDYLSGKGFDAKTCTGVIERLEGIGLLDDREFARSWVDFSKRKLKGSLKIRWELKKKGIDERIIMELLRDELSSEHEHARILMDNYLPPGYERNDRKLLRKTISFLKRRGYPSDVVFKITREYFE
ncbi:MAG: regulatory protein RecX, partial [Firmicutes bacterium]|nr:regulatory protein RecX [Bacillota bacterium]